MLLLRVLTFLPIVCGESGSELSELITRIRRESDAVTVQFIGLDKEIVGQFVKIYHDIPVAIFSSLASDYNKEFFNSSAIFVVQSPISENHQFTEMLEQFVGRLRVRKFVVISTSNLEQLFRYFFYFVEKKFTRIFGVAGNTSYAYLPFSDSPLKEFSKSDPLPDAQKDLNGFEFRTTVLSDLPRVFWHTNRQGRDSVGGYAGQLFVSFLQKHNARFKDLSDLYMGNEFMVAITQATIDGDIDISMNAYSPDKRLGHSYPIKMLRWTVMVPLNGYVKPNQYFLRPFSPTAWTFLGLTLAYIIAMDVLKDVLIGLPADIWNAFSRVLLIMLNMSVERPIRSAYRFYGQLLLFAFILVNFYYINLTSYLTAFIKVNQYHTIHDLIENNVPVTMVDYQWHNISNLDFLPDGFEKIVVPIDNSEFVRERNSMKNTSFGFALGSDRAQFLIDLQRNYAEPLFHTIRDSLEDYPLIFLLDMHSPFREILDRVIIQTMDAGLLQKWDRDAVGQITESKLVVIERMSQTVLNVLTLHHLCFAWICLANGLTLAMAVFVVERISKFFGCFIRRRGYGASIEIDIGIKQTLL